ncbi:ABC transporter ATP-binding protein [Pontibacter arcticus]|uniref:ABC transporter ATP-binding protein n=1 Tax=Pontibacter arcticus TaxID=2080288 RepID=A0A364RDE9_9BACT|nr:ABC transporter ATP-binding protein [Pontibacter arcticus]RAU82368.1 ABC transporter ATP-binding protein [Pontibacter arcticus]
MSEIIIDVQNLSKMYRLGTIGTGSFRQDLQRWVSTNILKKEEPFFQGHGVNADGMDGNDLWALNNVSFDVKKGEVLGIIGNNGSGKSTLLKIISRIVRPTQGFVRGNGKVSSLLEVGTGFHNELTGRENIFISGYTLGMSRDEIRRKFDEIVAFSGIEKFIDTPVKRYSSGMYVRLAFSVAAHLEPDILIVDEVLAVGDNDFQKKCLGKMNEIAQTDGRTILFVSHSMQAVNTLCTKALWLQNGNVKEWGTANDIVNKYVASVQKHRLQQEWDTIENAPGNDNIRVKSVEIVPHLNNPNDMIDIRTALTFKFQFWNLQEHVNISARILLFSYTGECVFNVLSPIVNCFKPGILEGECTIPGNFLNDGSYYISMNFLKDSATHLLDFNECVSFDMEDYRGDLQWFGKWWGAVRPQFPVHLEQKEMVLDV